MLKLFPIITLLFIGTGCAKLGQPTSSAPFEIAHVDHMQLHLNLDSDGPLQALKPDRLDNMSQEISQRFARAGYAVDIDVVSKQVTHELAASVGKPALTETPAGLSFGLGNSDPRASHFQKAVTVAIRCSLRPLKSSDKAVALTERKIIPSELDLQVLSEIEKRAKMERFYLENIGATCHKLLNRLNVQARQDIKASTASKTPTEPAFETVHIETLKRPNVSEPEPEPSHAEPTIPSPQPQTLTPTDDWSDQAIQIFNQGDTVTLEFGYERK